MEKLSETIPLSETINFEIGQTFTTYEEVAKSFKLFCEKYGHPFVIRSRCSKQIVYRCCHGIKQTSRSRGKRPTQHSLYKGCIAQINVYKAINKKWKITKMILEHNHTIGEEEFINYKRIKVDDNIKSNNCNNKVKKIVEKEQSPHKEHNNICNTDIITIIPNDISIVKIEDDTIEIDDNNIINDIPISTPCNLCKGQIFNSYDEVTKFVKKFCNENYHPFVIRTRSEKHIIYECSYGINTTACYTDCKAQINVYKNVQNNEWRITQFILNHNHIINKEEFDRYLKIKRNQEEEPKLKIKLEPKLEIVSPPFETGFISNNQAEMITPSSDPLSNSIILNEPTSAVVVDQNICGNYTPTNNDCNKNSHNNSVNINVELSDREKLSIALDLTKNIIFILSGYQTNIFNKYIDELKLIERNAKNGVSLLTNNEGNSNFASRNEYNPSMNESEIVLGKYECSDNSTI